VSGSNNPNPPVSVSSGGPAGATDKYIRLTSTGAIGAGGKLVVQNLTQWKGNYTAASITSISMHVKNEGANALSLRVALNGGGGFCSSVNAVSVPTGGGWISIVFPISASDLTGGTPSTTLTSVSEIRILHNSIPGSTGAAIAAQLGIDDITAAATPLPVELVSLTATIQRSNVSLHWSTATEINNYGFGIERALKSERTTLSAGEASAENWSEIGFVNGNGTSSAPHEYKYTDTPPIPGLYAYRIRQMDKNGTVTDSRITVAAFGSAPQLFTLNQNYPNPFNPATTIEFALPVDGHVVLSVHDMLGKEVARLIDGEMKTGTYQRAIFDGSRFPSGSYVTRLTFKGNQLTRKMILLK
jgi:hypothetical protein